MTSYKLYKPLFLSLSLALAGCGGGGDDDETPEVTTPEVTTPESTLSVANPIADIELIFGTPLDFTIADDTCVDSSGADITYNLSLSNNVGLSLVGSSITSLTMLTGLPESTGVVNVTATCSTDTDTLTDEFTVTVVESEFSPTVSLSFPLAFGTYNEDSLDMFGNVEAATGTTLNSVTVFVDDVETATTLNTAKTAWRVNNVTLSVDAEITIVADATITETSESIQQYEEITFNSNTVYNTSIDENISDIAVSESTGDIYVHSDGDENSDQQHITKFNLDTLANEELSYSKDATYGNYVRSSIATDSDYLYLSAATAITKIDLSTNIETVLSDATIDADSTAPQAIFDLGYNTISEELYLIDLNTQEVNTVDTTTGIRTNSNPATEDQAVSVARAANSFTYYAQGLNTTGAVNIYAFTSHTSDFEAIHSVDSPANGENGGPVSDLALNEAANELYFVDGAGDLIKLYLDTDPAQVTSSTVLEDLFTVESLTGFTTPLIGLHYDTTRNVIIAAGRDADGTNKLLVIDPVSGDYGKVATGTVD